MLWATTAVAFPTTFHYYSATEPSELATDFNSHWDSESSSDLVTFQRPLEWDGLWHRGTNVFDLSFGSISSKQFLTYQRLKMSQALTKKLEFRFHWIEERDFEQDRAVVPLELKYKFTSSWALSLFGAPSLYKSEDDLGLSIYFTPTAEWEYRTSVMWADYDRNKRNLQTDEWSEAPLAATVSARHLPSDSANDFFNVELHWEKPTQRIDNLGASVQDLAYEAVSFAGLKTLQSGSGFGARLLYDRAYTSDSGQVLARKRSLNQFEYSFLMGPHVVRPGVNLFYRESREDGDQFIYREILPTLWFQLPPKPRSWGLRTLSLGYDATVFEQQHQNADDRNLEHRLNVKYDMRFSESGQLVLLFTFDLDRFGSGETWEGGAGQFRLDF